MRHTIEVGDIDQAMEDATVTIASSTCSSANMLKILSYRVGCDTYIVHGKCGDTSFSEMTADKQHAVELYNSK